MHFVKVEFYECFALCFTINTCKYYAFNEVKCEKGFFSELIIILLRVVSMQIIK